MKTEFMKKEHIKEIARIEYEAFGALNAEKTLQKELENKIAVYIVALSGDKILGYIGIWNMCGEGDIINIAVDLNERKKGIGTFLLEKMFEYCHKNNIDALNLEVRESNAPARALYEKCGFIKVGERKRYYDGKETAVLMKKDFKSEG